MPARTYVEWVSLAAMLATIMSAGVAAEVNLIECVTCTHLPTTNKDAYSGFETQRRHHQKSKTGASVVPTKRTYVLQKLKKVHIY